MPVLSPGSGAASPGGQTAEGSSPSADGGAAPERLAFGGGFLAGDLEGLADAAFRGGEGLFERYAPVPGTVGGLPILLALLAAFLGLQRGIGRGLGHVPMAPEPPTQASHEQP